MYSDSDGQEYVPERHYLLHQLLGSAHFNKDRPSLARRTELASESIQMSDLGGCIHPLSQATPWPTVVILARNSTNARCTGDAMDCSRVS